MFHPPLPPQEGDFILLCGCRERTDTHTVFYLAVSLQNSSPPFPMLQSVVQQHDCEDPSNKPYWYGSLIFLDSAFILADFSDSFLPFSAFCC